MIFQEAHFLGMMGDRNSNIESLRIQFPDLVFKRIKQVHGDRIVHTSPHSIDFSSEADAHYTNEKGLALCIATADCIPVMIFHESPRWIGAIHAGWRGVEKRIVPKTIQALVKQGCRPEQMKLFIGPHIQKKSFEVGNDVRDLLLASCHGDQSLFEPKGTEKSLVDIHQILKLQLREFQIAESQITVEKKDTVTDNNFHSFRRDKDKSGRQLSWIALK